MALGSQQCCWAAAGPGATAPSQRHLWEAVAVSSWLKLSSELSKSCCLPERQSTSHQATSNQDLAFLGGRIAWFWTSFLSEERKNHFSLSDQQYSPPYPEPQECFSSLFSSFPSFRPAKLLFCSRSAKKKKKIKCAYSGILKFWERRKYLLFYYQLFY